MRDHSRQLPLADRQRPSRCAGPGEGGDRRYGISSLPRLLPLLPAAHQALHPLHPLPGRQGGPALQRHGGLQSRLRHPGGGGQR